MAGVCVVAARRTPQGRFLGGLRKLTPVDLAVAAARPMLESLPECHVEQVIIGNVLSAGHGMNVARQVGMGLKLPVETPAFSVNMMCASGLQAIRLGAQAIRTGDADVVLCGGSESMSNAGYLLPRARQGLRLGDGQLVDTLLCDGLIDAFDGRHMALQAEDLAARYRISREEQDTWAARSQQLHAEAVERGAFQDELVVVGDVTRDEHPRPGTTTEQLAELRPVFVEDGTVTAGNSSGINDGAALVVLARTDVAEHHGWPVMAHWAGSAAVGCEPAWMGLGPVHALRRLEQRCGVSLVDLGAIEINEAFAAQVLACLAELPCDGQRVNRLGGAIACGHPIGASGARLVVQAAHQLARGETDSVAVALCVGGGMGAAALLTAEPPRT